MTAMQLWLKAQDSVFFKSLRASALILDIRLKALLGALSDSFKADTKLFHVLQY